MQIHDRDDELRHYRALAACAAALLGGDDDAHLDDALHAVLDAVAAASLFVERNVVHPEWGPSTQLFYEVARPGVDTERERWALVPWSQLPDSHAVLSRGEPFELDWERLGRVERVTYEGTALPAELNYPVFVDGEWLGLVGFSHDDPGRVWQDTDRLLLAAVAELFGAIWGRRRQASQLEGALADAERRLRYEQALARCSQALLSGTDDKALEVALDELLLATGAEFGTIERNVEHPEVGLCSQVVVRSAVTPAGIEHEFDDHWFLVPWSRMPDSRRRLEKGVPFAFRIADLGPEERAVYEESPVQTTSEIDIPITVGGEWLGLLAFGFAKTDHDWAPEDTALFQTGADMVGAFWMRQSAHQRLEELIRSKDEFLAAVSHELRTPLTTVVGLAEELVERPGDFTAAERSEFTALIAAQGLEMAHLVEDLLVAARADIGAIELAPARVDVNREIAVVVSATRSRKAVAIRSTEECLVWADAMRVRQVIRNLLTNAVRYGGPDVRVEASVAGAAVTVTVSDDGPAIPENERERIFVAYERAHERATEPASVGLGLTVARRLARLMGGDLGYRRAAGRNAFVLTLPRAHAGSEPAG